MLHEKNATVFILLYIKSSFFFLFEIVGFKGFAEKPCNPNSYSEHHKIGSKLITFCSDHQQQQQQGVSWF